MFTVHVWCNSIDKQTKSVISTHNIYARPLSTMHKTIIKRQLELILLYTQWPISLPMSLLLWTTALLTLLLAAAAAADGFSCTHGSSFLVYLFSFFFFVDTFVRALHIAAVAAAALASLPLFMVSLVCALCRHGCACALACVSTTKPRWRTKDLSCCC